MLYNIILHAFLHVNCGLHFKLTVSFFVKGCCSFTLVCRLFFCNVTARVFANPSENYMESHKCKSKNDRYCNNITKYYSKIVLILLKTNYLWKGFFISLELSLQNICYTTECFTIAFGRPCHSRRFLYNNRKVYMYVTSRFAGCSFFSYFNFRKTFPRYLQ